MKPPVESLIGEHGIGVNRITGLGARFGGIFFVLHLALAHGLRKTLNLKAVATYSSIWWFAVGCEMKKRI